MRVRYEILLGLCICLPVASAHADDQSRLAQAREFITVSHATDSMRRILPMLLNSMKPMMAQQMGDPLARDAFLARFQDKALGEVDKFTDMAAQIYAREFTDDDLASMITFYKSPTGQHMVDKQAELQQALSAAGKQWGIMIASEAMQDAAKEQLQKQNLNMSTAPTP